MQPPGLSLRAAREGYRESGLSASLISLYRSPLFCFSSDLKIFRSIRPYTRDSFSRVSPTSARKSLIFLYSYTAAQTATSDKVQCVKVELIGQGEACVTGEEKSMERNDLKQWLENALVPETGGTNMSQRIHVLQALVELSNADLLAERI